MLGFQTGALLAEDSSKVSSNMDNRLLKNYARVVRQLTSRSNHNALKLP